MYGIYTYLHVPYFAIKNQPNVGKYTSPTDPSWGGFFSGQKVHKAALGTSSPLATCDLQPTWRREFVCDLFCGSKGVVI